jgi:hypothetical protein
MFLSFEQIFNLKIIKAIYHRKRIVGLGKEVTILISKKLNSGDHTYTFDGKNLASGVYYYQLVAGDFREVKKMILLR